MSDQQTGKKEIEREDLHSFIEAYKWVTSELLTEHSMNECPDFICARSNGQKVGLELTKVMIDPESAQWDRILNNKYEQDPGDTMDRISGLLADKENKRSKNYGQWTDNTILVLQLYDCSLSSLKGFITDDLQRDFTENGFVEVWLADYTGIEAYRNIELFGLFPPEWWGYHQRENPCQKPFG